MQNTPRKSKHIICWVIILLVCCTIIKSWAGQYEVSRNRKDIVFVWDVGGVILNWDPKKFIATYNQGRFLPYFKEIFGEEWVRFDRGDLTLEELTKILGRRLNVSQLEIEKFIYAAFLSLQPNWRIIGLIKQLQKNGYKNYCLTNGSKEYLSYINGKEFHQKYKFNLIQLFDSSEIVLSVSLHLVKPEPAIYQYTNKKFNLCNKQVVFVDDNKANIDGAKAFGWQQAILFTNIDDLTVSLRRVIKI